MNTFAKHIRRVVIAGPTGIGKTGLSLEIAQNRHYEIISADSRQCYKHLDIGTGKVTRAEMGDIAHYNVSVLDPPEPDTAAAFAKRAKNWEDGIISQNKIPLVVGGSTLHLQSLIWALDDIPGACVPNQIKLKELEKLHGMDHIFAMLQKVDPIYSTKMDGFNRNRTFRALDVYMQTGKPFSTFHAEQKLDVVPGDTLLIVLTCSREELVGRIESRVDQMLADGIVDETRSLLEMGYTGNEQALQTVGYREVIQYLRGEIDESRMISDIKMTTRRYAKRQATWFRRWKSANFIDVSGEETAQIARNLISQFKLPF